MNFWLIVALIAAIPTYGTSIALYFILSWAKSASHVKRIPDIIAALAERDKAICLKEIKFPVVLAFARESYSVKQLNSDYFEFTCKLSNGYECEVSVNRERGSNAAIIDAQAYKFIRVDVYTSSKVPMNLYKYWSNSGIDDFNICEMYIRNMVDDLNQAAELLNLGMTWEEICEIPIEESSKLSNVALVSKYSKSQ
ncbi:hypothetical protein [Vibrio sp. 10N.261.51.A4]|uniref:hypothetical protein n=1 Tax=Vibrio sp. 10N.261.51.A4 TaxID=3229674 RepID=UPI003551E288